MSFRGAFQTISGFNTSPVAQSHRGKRGKKTKMGERDEGVGGWSAVGEGEGVGLEEAVRPVDQARPKCKGCLADTAQLGSSSRFTDMTSVAPVQLFLW